MAAPAPAPAAAAVAAAAAAPTVGGFYLRKPRTPAERYNQAQYKLQVYQDVPLFKNTSGGVLKDKLEEELLKASSGGKRESILHGPQSMYDMFLPGGRKPPVP